MIKRICFLRAASGLPRARFRQEWVQALTAVALGPVQVRPVRVALCVPFPPSDAEPAAEAGALVSRDGVDLMWFRDAEHLHAYRSWLEGGGQSEVARLAAVTDVSGCRTILARELVLRGEPWLRERWSDGGAAIKHMAVARRAVGLTPADFSERWSGHAGRVGAGDNAVRIPDEVRGQAYLQNHPLPRRHGEWCCDAVNEVYLATEADLRRREAWYARTLTAARAADLVSHSEFLSVREVAVTGAPLPAV